MVHKSGKIQSGIGSKNSCLGVDVTCMHTSFGGRDPSGFGDMATFQKRPNFPFGAWTIVHGHGKIQSEKFMQVGTECMHTNFGGRE